MKYKAILLTCVTCMALAMTLSAMKYLQIKHAIESANSRPEVSESIEVHLVKNQNWQEQTTITGKVVVQNRIDLVSETAGRIEYIGFESGDSVEKGQILLRIDATQDMARRDAIVSEARLAEIALERIERLFKTGGASLEDLDEHRAEFLSKSASVRAIEAMILKKTITAPFEASAGLHQLNIGQMITPEYVITELVGTGDRLWIDFNVPQGLSSMEIGTVVQVLSEFARPLQEQIQNATPAEIVAKNFSVNATSSNIRMRAVARRDLVGLPHGSFVKVLLPRGKMRTIAKVPLASIIYDELGPYVFTIQPANDAPTLNQRAYKRRVKLGPQTEREIIILEGLQEGERIAGIGAFKLTEGSLVGTNDG